MRELSVKRVREHEGRGELIIESEIQDRNEAEQLIGSQILIDRDERVLLPDGRFWVDDLIGLVVQTTDGAILGVVEDFIIASGGTELYAVKDESGKLHYIPAVEEFVKQIDLAEKKIVVELIEGLW